MSYFSVKDFIVSGQNALKNKNYWCALSVALTLPSMCSRIMFDSENFKASNRNDENGYWYTTNRGKYWLDKKCYVVFCNTVMTVQNMLGTSVPDPQLISELGPNFAEVLYQLRCDIIHAGIANIYDDNKGLYLALGDLPSTDFSEYRMINIKDLCEIIFEHIDSWCKNNSVNNFKYTYVFDTENNNDDRILYNRLREKDKANKLEKEFNKERKKRKEVQNSENHKETDKNQRNI